MDRKAEEESDSGAIADLADPGHDACPAIHLPRVREPVHRTVVRDPVVHPVPG